MDNIPSPFLDDLRTLGAAHGITVRMVSDVVVPFDRSRDACKFLILFEMAPKVVR